MLSKLKITLAAAFAFAFFAVPLVSVMPTASAQEIGDKLCEGANLQFGDTSGCDAGGSEDKLNDLIKNIVDIFSVIVGIVAVIMIIFGGFKYITSGGDSGNVTGAKNTILYAIIGLVIVAFAQFIVKFVLTKSGDVAGN